MSDLKSGLRHIFNALKELEDRARKLQNQNLADIAASAHGKVHQLGNHPDLELLDEKKDQPASGAAGAYPDGAFDPKAPTTREEAISRKYAEGAQDPASAARVSWPHLFETSAQGRV